MDDLVKRLRNPMLVENKDRVPVIDVRLLELDAMDAATRIEVLEAENARLKAERDGSAWADGAMDRVDELSVAIDAAHPINSGDHDTFERAVQLVGARRSKYGLVGLVNYLLRETARLRAEMEWRPIETAPKTYPCPVVDLWVHGKRWPNMVWEITSPAHPYGVWKRDGDDWHDACGWLEPTYWRYPPAAPEGEG